MNRHKQRDYTFRVVFSMEQNITEIPLEDLDLHLDSAELQTEEDKAIIREKVTHIFDVLPEIDSLIEGAAERWSIDRIAKIELAILRVAIYDMKYDKIPVQIAVNEAVELSKKYGDDQSSKFVNGVLGQIVKKL